MTTGLGWYLDTIGRVPLLTPAEELHLGAIVRAWQDHPAGPDECPAGLRRRGIRARDRFVAANLRLSVSFVSKRCQHLKRLTDQDDLIQMANLGLVRAVERFDPARGYKFSTYAYWWIRQSVNRWADSEARMIRLPGHHSQQIRRLATITQQHLQEHGVEPTIQHLAAAADLTVERVRELLAEAQGCTSLDQQLEDGADLLDLIATDAAPEPDDSPERRLLLEHLNTLEPLARDVISALHGFHGKPLGATATARLFGLPGPREVRAIERQARQCPLRQQPKPPIVAPSKPEPFAHRLGPQIGLPLA
jgi:RNA polymerase sigma factor (sigma-70 family)